MIYQNDYTSFSLMNDHRLELSTDLCVTLQLIQEMAILQMAGCSPHLWRRNVIVDVISFALFSFRFLKNS
jgi:hypothetical protein